MNFSTNLDFLEKIIEESLQIYDNSYNLYTSSQMHVFLKYFSLLIEQFSLYGKSSNNKLASANTIRKILMRTKPLLSLKPGSLENRKVIQSSLSLYKDSIELLDGVPFEVNYFDHSAFSFEEESNVTIPNALF